MKNEISILGDILRTINLDLHLLKITKNTLAGFSALNTNSTIVSSAAHELKTAAGHLAAEVMALSAIVDAIFHLSLPQEQGEFPDGPTAEEVERE